MAKLAPWLTVKNEGDSEPVVMVISGAIGKSWWDDSGVSSKEFHDELNKIPKGKAIHVRINSEGGSIKDGLEIYNALKERRKDVTAFVDGYALSIASVIPLGADKVVSPKSSIWMLHEPWSMTQGNAEEHRHSAEMLDKHGDMLAAIYAEETGKSKKSMRDLMHAETWMTGDEAVDFGLADEVPEDAGQASFRPLDKTQFKTIPTNIFNMISADKSGDNKKHITGTTMNKTIIVALLKAHGIEAVDTETDEQLQAKLDKIPKAKKPEEKANDTDDSVAALQEIRAQLSAERKTRITAEVKRRSENRVQNDKLDWWVDLAVTAKTVKDEEAVYEQIDALPVNSPGGEALAFDGGNIIIMDVLQDKRPIAARFPDSPAAKIYAKHNGDRSKAAVEVKDNWNSLLNDAYRRDLKKGLSPLAANTYSATLVTSFLMDGSLTPLQNMWAPLRAFALEFSPDPYKPLATGVLKNPTAGGSAQTDATNFESGNSTVGPLSVTMHQYTVSFQVSNSDLNSGLRMQDLVTINSANFANKVTEVATAPITVANFTGTAITQPAAAFGFSDLATLQGLLKKSPIKNVILDGTYIANIANTPAFFQQAGVVGGATTAWRAFGWDLIAQNSDWTGAGTNVQGFACNPQAIVGITGLPLNPPNIPGGILQQSSMTIPGLETSIAVYSWFNTATRTMWASYDIMLGVVLGDATAGYIVKSA